MELFCLKFHLVAVLWFISFHRMPFFSVSCNVQEKSLNSCLHVSRQINAHCLTHEVRFVQTNEIISWVSVRKGETRGERTLPNFATCVV